jgi:ribonuclease D
VSSTHTDESLPLLSAPADGVPDLIDTSRALTAAAEALAAGTGPVAVDAERASGIRYGNRAFLVQLRRRGAGTLLIDPEALPDLTGVDEALRGVEWILHAATQDLPCLAERGMTPDALFDTEVAARLLGYERFGLAAVVGETLGVRLAKEHSNVDWSTRPLPRDWLNYAALDVELLIPAREVLVEQLQDSGKSEFARQEFNHLLSFEPTVYSEPWRRVNGLGTVRSRRALARVRSMWQLRDRLARQQDLAPGRIVRDKVLVELAGARIRKPEDLRRIPGVAGMTKASLYRWYKAIADADALPEAQLPPRRSPDSPPQPQVDRAVIKTRLEAMKPAVNQIAEQLGIPHDLAIAPRLVKALAAHSTVGTPTEVERFLREHDAREWQIGLTARALSEAAARADAATG